MGGSNCALSNCPAYKSKHRGLSFHKIPRKGENDAHRQLLIQTIDREDEWFMKEKKKDNANIFICSRHYSGECYKHSNSRKPEANTDPRECANLDHACQVCGDTKAR
ncbi:hypothetical protein ACOMHN_016394 [Nucella lapillus]